MNDTADRFELATSRCTPSRSPILHVAIRGLAPVIQIIGLYVFFHGHYSPGGGFQGGVLLAASVILLRLTIGFEASQVVMPSRLALPLSAVGVLIYAGTGLAALLGGGNFLQYASLPVPGLDAVALRNYGILFIEGGVTLTVMSTLVAIFDRLLEG